VSVYVSDWLSSVLSVGVRGSGLVTWSGMSSVSWGVLLLLLVALMGMMLNGVDGLGWYRGGWGANGSLS